MGESQAQNGARHAAEMTDPDEEVRLLEQRIADLKARWPQHSVPPRLWEELEELESRLETALRREAGKPAPDCAAETGDERTRVVAESVLDRGAGRLGERSAE